MLALGVKVLLQKTETVSAGSVERPELDDARCKWHVDTV
jgi:hypothetical protein